MGTSIKALDHLWLLLHMMLRIVLKKSEIELELVDYKVGILFIFFLFALMEALNLFHISVGSLKLCI